MAGAKRPKDRRGAGAKLSGRPYANQMILSNKSSSSNGEEGRRKFKDVLAMECFQGLKAILDRVSSDEEVLWGQTRATKSFEELLGRLGYRLVLTRQIHLADCYDRLGQTGGIAAVLPFYDIPTHSSFPTLVNFNHTVTATQKSAAFFEAMLANLKRQMAA